MANQKMGFLPTSSEPGPHMIGPNKRKIDQEDDAEYIRDRLGGHTNDISDQEQCCYEIRNFIRDMKFFRDGKRC